MLGLIFFHYYVNLEEHLHYDYFCLVVVLRNQ